MATIAPNPNEAWRNYTKRMAVESCKLRVDDLKKLYRLINEKQIELGTRLVGGFWKTDNETQLQFEGRCKQAKDAFITTVRVTGANAEVVTGHGEIFFDSGLLPEHVVSIEYDTGFSPNALLKFTPSDRASVFLDFNRPPLLGAGLPSEPTSNNSNWFVTAETEAWSTSISSRLEQFFAERKTGVDWLHRSNTYDGLLVLVGFPMALWEAYRIGHPITAKIHLPSSIETALYVYAFLLALNVFRWMFSYARWVFPKIELESQRPSAARHRVVWSALFIGIGGSALWDGIKALTGW